MNILIVDDMSENRLMLESFLQSNKYQTYSADNGKEALKILETTPVDLIISDILMPEMDGYMLCQKIKAVPQWTNIPLIFYSATFTSRQDEIFAIKLGANKFVRKPIEPDMFLKIIQEVLHRREEGVLETARYKFKDEKDVFRIYNERIIRKLEEKVGDLEKSENSLNISQDRLAKAATIAKLGYWDYNVQEDLFTFDDFFYAIFHTTAEKEGGYKMKPQQYAERFLHPDDQETVATEMQKALTATDPDFSRHLEHRILYADGGIGFISVNYFIEKDKQGRTIRTFGVNQDITARKRSENALRESEKKLREAQELARLGYWKWNIKTGAVEWSEEVFKIFSQDPKTFTPRIEAIMALSPWPEEHERDRELIERARQTHTPGSYEQKFLRPDNSIGYYFSTFQGNYNEKGDLITIIGTVLDITDRKKAETEKNALENQLLQSQKMEAIGNLAGGVAHDFNNLLTVIQGHAQLLMFEKNENDPDYHELKQIMNASLKAANLTRQLLLFSRRQAMEFKPININNTIVNLLKMIQRLIGENITIETRLEKSLWNIEADEGNLEQVIVNLVVNARDAMPNGGLLTIQTANINLQNDDCRSVQNSRVGQFMCLSISDTGVGIPAELIEKIFDPFFTTKEIGKGTGLGLAVVYGIIKKHNGWINVYSEPGRGTVMKIYLPTTEKNVIEETTSPVEIMAYPGNGEKILIVEDNAEVRRFTEVVLNQNGYQTFTAATANQALSLFQEEDGRFDLIISDVILPDKNGVLFAEEILRIKTEIPIILCSGYAEETLIQSIKMNRKFHFIQKPFQVQILLEQVYRILREK